MSEVDDLLDAADATEIGEKVRAGSVRAVDLVEASAARIEERNGSVNAVVTTRFDDAIREAERVDLDAPFPGVPFVTKDFLAPIAGVPETRGSRLFLDDVPTEDGELTKRYRAAGFIILATTNTPELGSMATTEPLVHGPTRNPHNLNRSAGGSSGGTAAAVACGMVPIGHGNDGGGSIRIPAAACGLVGLKPSRGRVPFRPTTGLGSILASSHVLTRSVRDSSRVLDATAGSMAGDLFRISPSEESFESALSREARPLRIGFARVATDGSEFDEDCLNAVDAAARLLRDLGHEVVEASPKIQPHATALMGALLVSGLRVWVDTRLAALGRELEDDDLEPFTHYLYGLSSSVSGADVIRALDQVELMARDVSEFFDEFDLWLSPTCPIRLPEIGELDTRNVEALIPNASTLTHQTSIFNITGQPAVSLPLAVDGNGVPVGVQLAAAYGREDLLFEVSAQVERSTPWSTQAAWSVA